MIECIKQVLVSHLLTSVADLLRANLGDDTIIYIIASESKDDNRRDLQAILRDQHDLDVYDPGEYVLVPIASTKGEAGPAAAGYSAFAEAPRCADVVGKAYATGAESNDPAADFPKLRDEVFERIRAANIYPGEIQPLHMPAPAVDLARIVEVAAKCGQSVSLSIYTPDPAPKNEGDDPNRV